MAKKSATQEMNELLKQDAPLTNEESSSVIDAVFKRPSIVEEQLTATAEGTSAISEGLKKIKSVERIAFTRKNREQQKNLNKYFYGLFPIVERKTVHVAGSVTLCMFDGTPRDTAEGFTTIVRDIGVVYELDDDQLLEAINKIKKIGLRFNGRGQTPSVFKITEEDPSEHYWQPNEYPLGQFCYFESVKELNQAYGNESGWRSQQVPMRPLIERTPIPAGYKGIVKPDMGDGWIGYWPVPKHESPSDLDEVKELSDGMIRGFF